MNEKLLRFYIFIFAAVLHIVIILFLTFDTQKKVVLPTENARVIRLTDISEIPDLPEPPPPLPLQLPLPIRDSDIPLVEEIAEIMIETDTPPIQEVVEAGTLHVQEYIEEYYLPRHLVSIPPSFDENLLKAALVYPPIALRSGIEGRVILELFVDRTGTVQNIIILREEPEGRGFGEAAVRLFTGRRGIPAYANGEPVSCRYRYPVTFTIR